MRLRTGRLWYSRGLDKGGLDQWDVLVRKIEKQKCTPILGPALTEYLLGGRREIVRRWAEGGIILSRSIGRASRRWRSF